MEAPRTIADIYQQFVQRREGCIKALTEGASLPRFTFSLHRFRFPPIVRTGFGCPVSRTYARINYTDRNEFYEQCDPNKENLCLYGA
jgi:hypothetical protein